MMFSSFMHSKMAPLPRFSFWEADHLCRWPTSTNSYMSSDWGFGADSALCHFPIKSIGPVSSGFSPLKHTTPALHISWLIWTLIVYILHLELTRSDCGGHYILQGWICQPMLYAILKVWDMMSNRQIMPQG